MTGTMVRGVRNGAFCVMVLAGLFAGRTTVSAHQMCWLECTCGPKSCGAGEGTTCRTTTANGGTCFFTLPGEGETESVDCNSWCHEA
jgi:hypothetical protein